MASSDKPSVFQHAASRAFQGGTSGALAMGIQVSTLMWMRTTMNYQYRYGTTTSSAMKALYASGGIRRFYRGFLPALFQGPLSRFGDTAANVGVLTLLEDYDMPVFLKTGAASVSAGLWRISIMPLDTLKTTLQVEGANALPQLREKIKLRGPRVLFHGAMAAASATMAGHFPWFFTYNYLQEALPKAEGTYQKLGRNALMGFVSSVVSDTISNSLRVIKTTRQTYPSVLSYPDVVRHIVEKDGVAGLLGRGLKTRILTNGLQGLMFSVLWRYFMDR